MTFVHFLGTAHGNNPVNLWAQQPGESLKDYHERQYVHHLLEALHDQAKTPTQTHDDAISDTLSKINPDRLPLEERINQINQSFLMLQKVHYCVELLSEIPQLETIFVHHNRNTNTPNLRDQIIGLAHAIRGSHEHQRAPNLIQRPVYRVDHAFDAAVFLVPANGQCMSYVMSPRGFEGTLDWARASLKDQNPRCLENRAIMGRQILNILYLPSVIGPQSQAEQEILVTMMSTMDEGSWHALKSFDSDAFINACLHNESISQTFIDIYYEKKRYYIEATPNQDGHKQSILDVMGHQKNIHYHRVTRRQGTHEAYTTEHYGEQEDHQRVHVYALVSDDYGDAYPIAFPNIPISEHVDQLIPLTQRNGAIEWDRLILALRIERSNNAWVRQLMGMIEKQTRYITKNFNKKFEQKQKAILFNLGMMDPDTVTISDLADAAQILHNVLSDPKNRS